ncbi:hypothetical protein TWF730_001174 [Orbilia blumenaviensis]|uniref:Envelope protein n=1 Tax=Orbilia blumenaviensis TaxID=1796055 RepID=A0AAV9VQZ3_9PEZI
MEPPTSRQRSFSCPEIGNRKSQRLLHCLPALETGIRLTIQEGYDREPETTSLDDHRSNVMANCKHGVENISENPSLAEIFTTDPNSEELARREALGAGQCQQRIRWMPAPWDPQWVGFRPRIIDFENECEDEPIGTPVYRGKDLGRSPWPEFPDCSPTRANSICSSISSSDRELETQNTTPSHEIEHRSIQPRPGLAYTGLRMVPRKKWPDPMAPNMAPVEPLRHSPGVKSTLPRPTQGKPEETKAPTNQQINETVPKKRLPEKVRDIQEWYQKNKLVILLVFLGWLTMLILTQTNILQISSWRSLNRGSKWKNDKYLSPTDSDLRLDPAAVVNLFFSKNNSQTIMDAKIVYHLENIREQQGRLHDKVQRQLNDNAIILEFMLREMQNLRSSFTAVADSSRMERQLDRLKSEIKQCNEDIRSKATCRTVIVKQRPTCTVTKMTKTVNLQNRKTSCPRHTVSTKVVFYPHKTATPRQMGQPGGLFGKIFGTSNVTTLALTDRDVDRITQSLAKSLNPAGKDKNPSNSWWSSLPTFPSMGRTTEERFTKHFELIIQLLCPEDSGFLAGSFAFRAGKCIKRRQELASIVRSRMQSTIPNKFLVTVAKFVDKLPPVGLSVILGSLILFCMRKHSECHCLAGQVGDALDMAPETI